MPRYVAFLRAVNVGGHVVTMDVLKSAFEGLGFSRVETFIASGNVLFESPSRNRQKMEARIEQALQTLLGYEVSTFVRSRVEVAAIAGHHPFPAPALAVAGSLNVGLLKAPLTAAATQSLRGLSTEIDAFSTQGAELYWICATGQSRSKISNLVLERALRVKTTLRGMKTMQKLAVRYPA